LHQCLPVKINIHEQIYAWPGRVFCVKQHEVPLAKEGRK